MIKNYKLRRVTQTFFNININNYIFLSIVDRQETSELHSNDLSFDGFSPRRIGKYMEKAFSVSIWEENTITIEFYKAKEREMPLH